MRILQINNVFDRLSTGKIVADIHGGLLECGVESFVAYARGSLIKKKYTLKFNWECYAKLNKILAFLTGIRFGGQLISTLRLKKYILNIKPDIVHLHCINDDSVNIYTLLNFLKSARISTVVTLHAEFFYTGNCGNSYDCEKWKTGCGTCPQIKNLYTSFDNTYNAWNKMRDAFCGFDKNKIIFASVSPWLMSRAVSSPVLGQYKHCTVLNGIDTDLFYRRNNAVEERLKLGINVPHTIMYVTSQFPSTAKGGHYIIEIARKMPDINILVLGEKTEVSELPSNIKLVGRIYEREKMALYYSMCDATILVSRSETFSMPVAESLCCGTPVVGFNAGGPESICIPEYCNFVEYGNIAQLELAIREILDKNFNREEISKSAIAKYSKNVMAEAYIQLYKTLYLQ